jgi:hypothetical protein
VRTLLPSEWITGGSSLLHYPQNQRALTMALASPFNRSDEPERFSSFSLSA